MIVAVGRLQHGRHGEQGAEHLQHQVHPRQARHRHRRSTTRTSRAVVAHEYFHNWTGNRVTCRDWFQLSLKEGLTVFRDQQFSADMNSRARRRRGRRPRRARSSASTTCACLRAASSPRMPGRWPTRCARTATWRSTTSTPPTVYEKGAEVIRMLHTLLGPEGFRNGMDLYFSYFDGQAVTCDDFVEVMSEANNGFDLDQFMRWYSQAGTPRVKASGAVERRRRQLHADAGARATPATPGQHAKLPLVIPVAVGLIGADGRDLPAAARGRSPAGRHARACSSSPRTRRSSASSASPPSRCPRCCAASRRR